MYNDMAGKLLDGYEIKARLLPAFITLAPIILVPYVLFPDVRSAWGALGGVLAALGLTAALARFARAMGTRCQAALFESWDGPPATAMLRHSDDRINAVTKAKMHAALGTSGPRLNMPNANEEAADPVAADEIYDAAVDWLRRHTRESSQYPLVFAENISYGFMRNLYGMKPLGIVFSVMSLGVVGTAIYYSASSGLAVNYALMITALVIQATLLVYWLWHIKPSAVRVPAEGYARALLECCWDIGTES